MKALIALLFGLLTIPALADNTIVENLQELIETRDAITNAIVQKGGTVTSGALTNVPNEILSIPSGGGGDNSKLLEIVQRTATEITATDLTNCVDIGRGSLGWLTKLTSIEIPSTVTNIGPYAFQGDTALKQITIPDSVEYFGDTSIRDCWNGGLVVDFGGTRQTIPFLNRLSGSIAPPARTKILVPEALMGEWKNTNGWQSTSWRNAIYPHIDFDPYKTYVVNAGGQVICDEFVLGRLTDDIIDNWVNEGIVQFDGTETLVIGLGVQNITASVDECFGPEFLSKLEFLDRELNDVVGWSNYPWNFVTNSTLFFLDSSVDHTIK